MGKKGRIVDILLLAVIAVSVGLIGYRFMSPASSHKPAFNTVGVTGTVVAPTTRFQNQVQRPAHPQWLLVKVLPIDTPKYLSMLTKYSKNLNQVEATSGCVPGEAVTEAVSLLDQVVSERVKSGDMQFLFGFKQPRCYRKNQKLSVLYYGRAESEPFVASLGEVTIESIVENEPSQMPEELLGLMGISREEYDDFVGFMRPPGLKDMLIKFGRVNPVKVLDGTVPLGFPRAEVVTAIDVEKLMARIPNLRVLDVRSPDEFYSGHLAMPHVENVPFILSPNIPKQFAWSVLNRDVLQSKFNANKVAKKQTPILIYGASAKDPRPLYAMADLIRLGFRQIYWLRDGFQVK